MKYKLVQISDDLSTEPVSTDEVKSQARIVSSSEDTLIAEYATSARLWAEEYLGRALTAQQYYLYLDNFPYYCWNRFRPHGEIIVPKPPLVSVDEITYLDTDGVSQTVDAANYIVDSADEPGRIVPAYQQYWPGTRCQTNAVRVTFTCGYGAESPATVPEPIKTAIKGVAAWLFQNRELSAIPQGFYWMLDPYRVARF